MVIIALNDFTKYFFFCLFFFFAVTHLFNIRHKTEKNNVFGHIRALRALYLVDPQYQYYTVRKTASSVELSTAHFFFVRTSRVVSTKIYYPKAKIFLKKIYYGEHLSILTLMCVKKLKNSLLFYLVISKSRRQSLFWAIRIGVKD